MRSICKERRGRGRPTNCRPATCEQVPVEQPGLADLAAALNPDVAALIVGMNGPQALPAEAKRAIAALVRVKGPRRRGCMQNLVNKQLGEVEKHAVLEWVNQTHKAGATDKDAA